MFFKKQRFHFVGIGGIGMSGIAEVLLNLGYEITGSDLRLSANTARLAARGARIFEGHDARHIEGAKAVVVSSAVPPDNPELAAARQRQIPVIPRGELLAELMRLKYGIAIAGSHGKTTTTSMTASILSHAGLDPTVVVGGRVGTMGGANARVGQSDFLVVESDESDGSFLKLAPILAVVTNIDREHLDHYPDLEAIQAAFTDFVNKVPFYGAAIVCLDDPHVQAILPAVRRRTVTYGHSAQADLRITGVRLTGLTGEFELRRREADLGLFRVPAPGAHNILNATAAIGVALELEVPPDTIRTGLAAYAGVDRRFQIRGRAAGVTVIDDYGHHPTEVRATLEAAKLGEFERVHVLFQPHRYTRTAALMDDFARSFYAADFVYVLDIYAASETPIEGITGAALAQRMVEFGHRGAQYTGQIAASVAAVTAAVRAGDAVFTMGAGNVWQAGEALLEQLAGREPGEVERR